MVKLVTKHNITLLLLLVCLIASIPVGSATMYNEIDFPVEYSDTEYSCLNSLDIESNSVINPGIVGIEPARCATHIENNGTWWSKENVVPVLATTSCVGVIVTLLAIIYCELFRQLTGGNLPAIMHVLFNYYYIYG